MAILSSVDLGEGIVELVVSHDPTVVATDALKGSWITEQSTGFIFIKTDDGSSTNVKKILSQAGQIFAGAGETTLENVENLKVNLGATTNPAASNDNTEGYAVGSRWINVTLDKEFVAVDVSTAAAVWIETTGAGGGTHASTHSDGGADEITVENLATGSVDTSNVLKPDGAGGLTMADLTHAELASVGIDDHHARDHAATHSDGGADEITVENLATGSVDTSNVLKPDGVGGVVMADLTHAELASIGVDDHHARDHAATHSDGGADEVNVENLAATSVDVSAALRPDGLGGVTFSDVNHGDLIGVTADQHHNQTHDLEGADHTLSGAASGEFLRATGATSFAMEAVPFSRGGTILDPTGAINIIAWRAPFACTVTNVRGYRVGGTGATINARKNGTDTHLASAVSLASADTWTDGGAVQNTAYAAGDKLEIMVVSITGTPTQIAVQVDFTRP